MINSQLIIDKYVTLNNIILFGGVYTFEQHNLITVELTAVFLWNII